VTVVLLTDRSQVRVLTVKYAATVTNLNEKFREFSLNATAVTAKYPIPTTQASQCVVCHKTIDPVAGPVPPMATV